ncbi:class I SAM-dependent methyltransferase [Streptomyces sp. YIM 98790]|uniref:class I SAM-dependent methyltransferase n=1 Tax=Streptomyces sp. YIM 98790 TaxID=2689077 RepID=UPI0028BDE1B6|nr:class I SAM-dependent methyltransferase [Streptomyces sp. YIM 98790]
MQEQIPDPVRDTYGPADLAATPAFAGGFINFGYWEGIPLAGPLTADDRVASQRNLYRRVLAALGGTRGRHGLEVGCGLGLGCELMLRESQLATVTGMDIHPRQLERARRANERLLAERPARLSFAQGSAERMPFGDGEFGVLYSVEAAQHFRDLAAFAREARRVLRPGGRLAVAGFFVPTRDAGAAEALAGLLDSFASGLDVAHPVAGMTRSLGEAGLHRVRAEPIGEAVWAGLDAYLAQIDLPVTWPRNFLRAYRDRLLDYYIVTATT